MVHTGEDHGHHHGHRLQDHHDRREDEPGQEEVPATPARPVQQESGENQVQRADRQQSGRHLHLHGGCFRPLQQEVEQGGEKADHGETVQGGQSGADGDGAATQTQTPAAACLKRHPEWTSGITKLSFLQITVTGELFSLQQETADGELLSSVNFSA